MAGKTKKIDTELIGALIGIGVMLVFGAWVVKQAAKPENQRK
jgi:hypothetical protein